VHRTKRQRDWYFICFRRTYLAWEKLVFLGECGRVLDDGGDYGLAGDGGVGAHLVELFLGYGLGSVVVDYIAVIGCCGRWLFVAS